MTMPFLLVPGLNCTGEVYRSLAPALWSYGPVTIANHLTGSTIEAMAAAILGDAPPSFALVGFSMGGYIGFEILRRAPERVRRVVLIDTSARPDAAEATEVRRRRISQTQAGKFGLVVEQSFPATVHPDNLNGTDLLALHRRMAMANGPEAYVRHQTAIIERPDSRPGLAAIGVPALAVVGEADQITPPTAAREIAAGISEARLVVIAGAGHFALLERPDAVAAALTEWIAA